MRTLRARLFAYLALAAFVSSLLTVIVAGVLTRRAIEQQVERNLARQVATVAGQIQFVSAQTSQALQLFFGRQGELLLIPGTGLPGSALRTAIVETGATSGKVEVLGRGFLFALTETPAGPLILARPSQLVFGDFRPFLPILILSGLGGAAVAAGLAYLLARRISRPLARVADASRRLAAGESDVRVAIDGEDELAGLAASFNRMAEDLAVAREAERTFLLSASHELRTPLTAVRGYAEALADGATEPEEAGRVIAGEAERLERLVQDLLDLARLDQRRFTVSSEPVDLNEVARAVEERYAPRAQDFGVTLAVEAGEQAGAVADRDRLVQVASNLVENALRSTPAGGRVVVRTARRSIAVEDTGPGLSPEDLPRAFERFYLHGRYRGGRSVGSGLGLAIVRELTEAMGGSVSVQSTLGGGTAFLVTLPG